MPFFKVCKESSGKIKLFRNTFFPTFYVKFAKASIKYGKIKKIEKKRFKMQGRIWKTWSIKTELGGLR
jgi:hypothetical protein